MLIDALVLAGGRSSRLAGVPKAELVYRETTLLRRTVSALSRARRVAVVGPVDGSELPEDVVLAREDPPFGGPAAGIAAGIAALAAAEREPGDYTIVVACDMPRVYQAIDRLLQQLPATSGDGVIAIDPVGRLQPLAAIYRTARLAAAAEAARRAGGPDGLSTFQFIAGLRLTEVQTPAGATDDIDTWADARKFGVMPPSAEASAQAAPRPAKANSIKEK